MARHEDREPPDTSALAEALEVPLQNGSLEAALHAARAHHSRHPGDHDARRLVEALELLMAQVWFGGAEDTQEVDARYVAAAQHLESLDFQGALARYHEVAADDPSDDRARRLALRVEVVIAARAGQPLPPDAPSRAVAPTPFFQETTRIAEHGELPLAAFDDEERTLSVAASQIPSAAYPDEPTRQLRPGDYELYDDGVHVEPSRPEITRIAQAGELPIAQAQREGEAAPEGSLVLDITVEDEDPVGATSTQESSAPQALARAMVGPSNASRGPAVAPARPPSWIGPSVVPDPVLARSSDAYASSAPPPGIPHVDQLQAESVHAPLDTGEVTLPPVARWEIREPGGEPEPQENPHPSADTTWAGVRPFGAQPATFEPGIEPVDADTWGESDLSPEEKRAELLVESGELGEALRVYQDLAGSAPDQTRLWARIKEIARMLQERSKR